MRKLIYIMLGVLLTLVIITSLMVFFAKNSLLSEKNKKEEYLPCPVLEDGETMDIMIPETMYYGSSATTMARYYKEEGRCVDAWVNDDGVLVVRLDQDTLEINYKFFYDALMQEVKDEDPELRMEVSYDYSLLTFYVNDNTTLDSFVIAMMVTPGNCYMLRLMNGIESYRVTVDVAVIYEPTGKEILRIDENTKMNINRDDWEKLLESGRQ